MKAIADGSKKPENNLARKPETEERRRSRAPPRQPNDLALPRRCACGGGCPNCEIPVQAKLRVSEPGDKYEQEADRVADEAVNMAIERDVDPSRRPPSVEDPRKTGPTVLRKILDRDRRGKDVDDAEFALNDTGSLRPDTGHFLPIEVRSFFEARMGGMLSNVCVHTGNRAHVATQALNAEAFTIGHDIFFADGFYAPTTKTGLHLLAHELAHVIQQRASPHMTPFIQLRSRRQSSKREETMLLHGEATSYLMYRIESGDTLSGIAERFDVEGGWQRIVAFNSQSGETTESHMIRAGEWLRIPYEAIRDAAEAEGYLPDNPLARRAEIKVDPQPPRILTLGEPIRPRVDAHYALRHLRRSGDEDMRTADSAAIGPATRESITDDSIIKLVSALFGGPTTSEADMDRRLDAHGLRIYLEMRGLELEELIEEITEEVTQTRTTPTVPDPERVLYFDFDSTEFNAALTSSADRRAAIAHVVGYIQYMHAWQRFHSHATARIAVEGYSSPAGSEAHNEQLSHARAERVERDLTMATDVLRRTIIEDSPGGEIFDYVIWARGMGVDDELIIY